MSILTRRPRSTSADGANPSSAIPAPRRAPSWPRPDAVVVDDPFWTPAGEEISFRLPPENRNLLTAYPAAPPPAPHPYLAAMAVMAAARRSGCRILAASARFEYEAAVGQNFAMLADQPHPAVSR